MNDLSYESLRDAADPSLIKRGLLRYLVPKNRETSIKRHKRIGTPIVKKIVMGTVGWPINHFNRKYNDTGVAIVKHYNMSRDKGRVEGAISFAFGGSVFSEAIHLPFGVWGLYALSSDQINDTGPPTTSLELVATAGATALNLSLVALQRYNRSRAIHILDKSLENGREINPSFRNWSGVDGQAYQSVGKEPICVTSPAQTADFLHH